MINWIIGGLITIGTIAVIIINIKKMKSGKCSCSSCDDKKCGCS